ncbi:MAG: maleylacetoacetate isomerase [Bauldia sp.]
MRLYSFWRSTATYRVRIALNLKGLSYDIVPLHLLRDGGEQRRPVFLAVNPQGRVPTLELDDGRILAQSMAILEWLEETHPDPPLLPRDPLMRATVRRVALTIVADVHPLSNTGVLAYLREKAGFDEERIAEWSRRWIGAGLGAIEELVEGPDFCFGGRPTFADLCVVPQVFNAHRFKLDLSPFPKIRAIDAHCRALPAFARAAPSAQVDAEA